MKLGFLLMASLLSLFTQSSSSLSSEGSALLSLVTRWTSVPNSITASWTASDSTPCSWLGIACDAKTLTVISIDLSGYGISGSIGPEIGQLTHLQSLNLSSNDLTGDLPSTLQNLHSLRIIQLYENSFSGEIPSFLFRIPALEELYLSTNNFSGSIPNNVGNSTSLVMLYLHQNSLTGSIPSSIGNCTELVELTLDQNKLSGTLPRTLSRLKNLDYLNVANNRIVGEIPSELGELKSLSFLDLGHNLLTGKLPSSLGNCTSLQNLGAAKNGLVGEIPASLGQLVNLENLYLPVNGFSGKIPPELGNCKELIGLQLYTNQLDGEIPGEFGSLRNLQELSLFDNRLSGEIPIGVWKNPNLEQILVYNNSLTGEIPSEIADLKQLKNVSLFNNEFFGELPRNLGVNASLLQLDFTNNKFSGEIPPNLCFGNRLRILNLGSNGFGGSVPSQIVNCSALKRLILKENELTGEFPKFSRNSSLVYMDISGNRISGPIPASLGNCINVSYINLSANKFSGSIPIELGNLKELQTLILSRNNLVGFLPLELANCTKIEVFEAGFNSLNGSFLSIFRSWTSLSTLILSENRLAGGIPPFLTEFEKLSVIELGGNPLGGEIPISIGAFQIPIFSLNLSHNGLSGKLPSTISNLMLERFDISHNNLTGTLAPLANMPSLLSLDVSFNNFTGELPSSLMKSLRSSPTSFTGNPGLCINCDPSNCSSYRVLRSCNDLPSKRKSLTRLQIAMITLGSTLVLDITVTLLFVILKPRRLAKNSTVSAAEGLPSLLKRVMEATEDLNDRFIIGTGAHGTVYKASLGPNLVYAVKKLVNVVADGSAHVTMVREIETLGKIRHRNLIKLEDFWLRKDYGLILYEYMKNGSLHDVLHGGDEATRPVLEWRVRCKIAVGTAHGLAYLHFDCDPAVVHRDIKPKNILLDEEMEAHISDFGIAKLLDRASNAIVSVGVVGTIGYIAPENAFTSTRSMESDVYSYGVVLLELVTRKMALDPTFGGETDIVSWVRSSWSDDGDGLDIEEVADPDLAGEMVDLSVRQQVVEMVKLALKCTENDTRKRPTMRHVVNQLTDIFPQRLSSFKS